MVAELLDESCFTSSRYAHNSNDDVASPVEHKFTRQRPPISAKTYCGAPPVFVNCFIVCGGLGDSITVTVQRHTASVFDKESTVQVQTQ